MSAQTNSQIVGAGLTLMFGFGPTLGMDIPYGLRALGFAVGIVLIFWPLWAYLVRYLSRVGKMWLVAGMAFCALGFVVCGVALWQSTAPLVLADISTSAPEVQANEKSEKLKALTPLEKQQLDKALFEFFESIRTQTKPALNNANSKVRYWHRQYSKGQPPDLPGLRAVRDEIDAAEKDLFRLLRQHDYVREEWDAVVHGNFNVWSPLMPAINNLISFFEHRDAYTDTPEQIEARWSLLENSIATVAAWAEETSANLKRAKDRLRE